MRSIDGRVSFLFFFFYSRRNGPWHCGRVPPQRAFYTGETMYKCRTNRKYSNKYYYVSDGEKKNTNKTRPDREITSKKKTVSIGIARKKKKNQKNTVKTQTVLKKTCALEVYLRGNTGLYILNWVLVSWTRARDRAFVYYSALIRTWCTWMAKLICHITIRLIYRTRQKPYAT